MTSIFDQYEQTCQKTNVPTVADTPTQVVSEETEEFSLVHYFTLHTKVVSDQTLM